MSMQRAYYRPLPVEVKGTSVMDPSEMSLGSPQVVNTKRGSPHGLHSYLPAKSTRGRNEETLLFNLKVFNPLFIYLCGASS